MKPEDIAKFLLRITAGGLLLFHVNSFLHGDPGVPSRVAAWHLPPATAWLGVAMEAGGAILVILGVYGRIGGLLITMFMISALVMAHSGMMGQPNHWLTAALNPGGTHYDHYYLEAQMFYLTSGICIFILGSGRIGLNIGGRWN